MFSHLQLVKLVLSFSILKWRVDKGLSTRCALSLSEILLLLIPSTLLVAAGAIYYSLQRTFEDELVIQVRFCFRCSNSVAFRLRGRRYRDHFLFLAQATVRSLFSFDLVSLCRIGWLSCC